MNILLAGGAGFLGSHLAEGLIEQGHQLTIVDNLSSGLLSNLDNVIDKVKFVKADISDYRTDDKFGLIINLASRASRVEWETYPVEVALANGEGNHNLIKIALESNSKYIFASTSEVYGTPDVVPTPEGYIGKVSSTGSRSPYDEGKRYGEALVMAYHKQFGLNSTIIRFFNTYGPRMRGDDFYGRVVDRFIKQCLSNSPVTVYGDGTQTRSFTYVKDSVNGILKVMERGTAGEVYNIGSDEEIKIIDLAELIISETKSRSKIVFKPLPEDDPLRRGADVKKLIELGWARQYSLQEGIRKMISFMQGKVQEISGK